MSKLNLDGQEALNEIKTLILEVANLKKALKNISTSGADNFDKLENNFSNLKTKVGELGNKLNYLEAIIKKNTSATSQNTAATNQNASAQNKANIQFKSAIPTLKQLAAVHRANTKATKKATKANSGLSDSIKAVFAAFGLLSGIQILKDIIKNVFETTKTFDSLGFALDKITGSNFDAAASQRFLLDITEKFGTELVSTTNRWIKFLAAAKNAGLALRDTENIFRSMTKAAGVLGLDTKELTGVYLALEQMLSKGKVTTEELRRQLGERLPGAMGIMAAAIGVTIPKLDEMLKKGEVLSAEVLPKFAEAVELAYNIESVENIDTLVAAQNRLTKSWQLFIKNVTEGDSVVKKFFGFFINLAKETITDWNKLLSTDAQKLEVLILGRENEIEKELEESFNRKLNIQKGALNLRESLEREFNKSTIALERAVGKEEIELAESNHSLALKNLKEFNEERLLLLKEYANNNVQQARDEYEAAVKAKKEFSEETDGTDLSEDQIKRLANINTELIETTALLSVLKKLSEESEVVVPKDEDIEKTQRNLRIVKDLYLEIQNEILKFNVDGNKRILDNEKSSIEERRAALIDMYKNEKAIAENDNLIKIRDTEARFKKETEALEKSLANGRLSRIKYNAFILELEKEKDQKLELAMIALSDKLLEIQDKNFKLNIEIDLSEDAIIIDKIEDDYNRRIIAIKAEYDAFETSAKRKKELEKELKDLSVEMANEIIEAKLAILYAELKNVDIDTEYGQKLIRDINDLRAARKSLTDAPEDTGDWADFWNEILGFAGEFVSAIGDITDGIFGNRIENINAEIEAERNKYDELIRLAEGEEAQQQALRLQKEDSIKKLEKKRLKEEQKQARAKKAFAVADISIKTAQAILGIWADVPKVDFGISAGLLTAFVSALGAAQIGAVLAQPIPKYKEGSKGIKREHIGMINDGFHKEYIERKGEILTTDRKNAIVNLLPGDVIYKNYDEMKKKSSAINAMSNYNRSNQKNNKDNLFGIQNEIKKGFKGAKINTKIINKIDSDNARYADSMSRWN